MSILPTGTLVRVTKNIQYGDWGRRFKEGQLVFIEDYAPPEDDYKGTYTVADLHGYWSGQPIEEDAVEDASDAARPYKLFVDLKVELEVEVIAKDLEEAIKLVKEDPAYYLDDFDSRYVLMRRAVQLEI